MFAANMTKQ